MDWLDDIGDDNIINLHVLSNVVAGGVMTIGAYMLVISGIPSGTGEVGLPEIVIRHPAPNLVQSRTDVPFHFRDDF